MAVLRRVYATLRMTCGPLTTLLAERGADGFRALLGQVMPLLIKLTLSAVQEDSSRPDVVEGMCFLPVDRLLYLRVLYLVNLVKTRHHCVRYVMVMNSDQLVWSDLTQSATQLIHGYLVHAVAAPALASRRHHLGLLGTDWIVG